MFPPYFFGRRNHESNDLHKLLDEKRPIRRGKGADPSAGTPEPYVSFDLIVETKNEKEHATLIELAKDPRFADRIILPKRQGPIMLLGRALMWAGWQLVRRSAAN